MFDKYVPLKAVLNYIPSFMKQTVSDPQIFSWAMQGFRANVRLDYVNYDYQVCVSTIKQFKAPLPNDIYKIARVFYTTAVPWDENSTATDYFIQKYENVADDDDVRIIIAQKQIIEHFSGGLYKVKYAGRNPELLTKDCLNLYSDPDCELSFSVDKTLTQLTLDIQEGYAVVVYKTLARNDGNLIVPDSPLLMRAMASYAEAMYWQDESGRNPSKRYNEEMFQRRMSMASGLFTEAVTSEMLRTFNPDTYMELLNEKMRLQKHPSISGKHRNLWRR